MILLRSSIAWEKLTVLPPASPHSYRSVAAAQQRSPRAEGCKSTDQQQACRGFRRQRRTRAVIKDDVLEVDVRRRVFQISGITLRMLADSLVQCKRLSEHNGECNRQTVAIDRPRKVNVRKDLPVQSQI